MVRTCLLLFLFCLSCRDLGAQSLAAMHFNTEDGLASNEVYDVHEDSLGYIWFATDHGISRFNGYEFQNFSTADGLTHNTVFEFAEDLAHRIWMRCFDGSLCYIEKGEIFPYRHNAALQAFLKGGFILHFGFDCEGNLWFVDSKGVSGPFKQDARSGAITEQSPPPGTNAFARELGCGAFLAGAFYKVRVPPSDSVTQLEGTWYFSATGENNDVADFFHSSGTMTEKDRFIVSNGLDVIEIFRGRIAGRSHPGFYIFSATPSQQGGYWITGDSTLCLFTAEGQTCWKQGRTPVTAVLEDSEGGIWLSRLGEGVSYIPDREIRVFGDARGEGSAWFSMESWKGGIWVQNESGRMYRMQLSSGDGGVEEVRSFGRVHRLNDFAWHEKKAMLLMENRGISVASLGNGSQPIALANYPLLPFLLHANRRMFLSGDTLLVAGNDGWAFCDLRTKHFFESKDSGFASFSTAVAMDESGRIWVGTTQGLFEVRQGKTLPYRPEDSRFRQRVTDLLPLDAQTLAVSTRGGGVLILRNGKVHALRKSDGLSSDLCGRMLYSDSTIWVASNEGLSGVKMRWEGDSLSYDVRQINTRHGMPSSQINDLAVWGGWIWVSTAKGLAWFDPAALHPGKGVFPVYITGLNSQSRSIAFPPELNPSDRSLAFEFIGLQYRQRGNLLYRYRLAGHDTAWSYTTERSVRYHNLSPGEYSFEVTALNEHREWNLASARLSFVIPQHITETVWFRSAAVILLAGGIGLVVMIVFRSRREKERVARGRLMAELKALRSQMKPHFMYNALNSIQHFILEGDVESAAGYLSRFSELMRKVLDHSRRETVSLGREMETLELYLTLEKLRFGDGFDFSVETGPGIHPDAIEIPPLLIQVFAENAIWHGLRLLKKKPRLCIRFHLKGDRLVCEVEDNGIGRKASAEHKSNTHESLGMKNAEERIGILNATGNWDIRMEVKDLYDEQGAAAGTLVIISFPIQEK